MLRSIARHFNETVFRGPADDLGSGDQGDADTGNLDTGADEGGDEGGADEGPLSVRDQVKRSIDEIREASAPEADKGKDGDKGIKRDKTTGRITGKEKAPAAAGTAPQTDPTQQQQAAPALEPPTSLSPEAKAAWKDVPPAVQQAVIKREQDMQAGVDQLKNRYALIDQAIAPHHDALRQMNATPQEAVNRMFLWFKALAANPTEAFPQLAQNLGIPWDKLAGSRQQPGQQPQPGQVDPNAAVTGTQTGAPEIPEPIKQYIGQLQTQFGQQLQQAGNIIRQQNEQLQQLNQRFGNVEQTFAQQSEAKTVENLNIWSKDKPYFAEVRQDMARLIESGAVPVKADGQVDLDTAYEQAIYWNKDVRAKVLAEQQLANTQTQQETAQAATTARQTQVAKARKAAVSLPGATTPGATNTQVGAQKKKPGEKLSVRESLKNAVAELRDQ